MLDNKLMISPVKFVNSLLDIDFFEHLLENISSSVPSDSQQSSAIVPAFVRVIRTRSFALLNSY